jgi:hypothetical protein
MRKTVIMVLFMLLCPVWAVLGQQSQDEWEPFKDVKDQKRQEPAGQQAGQPLTNESIIGLVKIGFSDETIISMVQHEPGNYSLRADDVIALKKAGVSEGVIAAMSSKMAIGPTPAPIAPAAVAPPRETELKREPGQGAKEKDQPAQPLTNESIVKLVKAGLSEDTIIKVVDTQPGKYSLGVEDVIALKKAGVSEKAITAMLNKLANKLPPAPATPARVPEKQDQPSPGVSTEAVPSPPAEATEVGVDFKGGNTKKDFAGRYNKKFLVVMRDGLSIAICSNRPSVLVRPAVVLIDGDKVEFDKRSGFATFMSAFGQSMDERQGIEHPTCEDVSEEPLHKGEVLSVHGVRVAHQRLNLSVRAISPHSVTRGVGAFEHESLERGSAVLAFQLPDPKDVSSVTALVNAWVKPFDSEAEAAQIGNTASGAFVKEVKLGMTPAEVEAALGLPGTKVDLGEKVLYKYKTMTVEFHDGKVTDVR